MNMKMHTLQRFGLTARDTELLLGALNGIMLPPEGALITSDDLVIEVQASAENYASLIEDGAVMRVIEDVAVLRVARPTQEELERVRTEARELRALAAKLATLTDDQAQAIRFWVDGFWAGSGYESGN
jgi:hypothetical protein